MKTLHRVKSPESKPKLTETQLLTLKYVLYTFGEAKISKDYEGRTRIYRVDNDYYYPYFSYHRYYDTSIIRSFAIDWSKVIFKT